MGTPGESSSAGGGTPGYVWPIVVIAIVGVGAAVILAGVIFLMYKKKKKTFTM